MRANKQKEQSFHAVPLTCFTFNVFLVHLKCTKRLNGKIPPRPQTETGADSLWAEGTTAVSMVTAGTTRVWCLFCRERLLADLLFVYSFTHSSQWSLVTPMVKWRKQRPGLCHGRIFAGYKRTDGAHRREPEPETLLWTSDRQSESSARLEVKDRSPNFWAGYCEKKYLTCCR